MSPAPPSTTAVQDSQTAPSLIRVGGNVMQTKLLRQPIPKYPRAAKSAHIEGTVVLHAIITKEGTISDLQLISGPPELVKAAMEAVKKWRYQPTLVKGEPSEVDTTVSIVFTLH